jgi:hypothetical protein
MSMPNPPGATLGDGWTWTAGARTDMPRGLQWKHDENEGWKTFDPSARYQPYISYTLIIRLSHCWAYVVVQMHMP